MSRVLRRSPAERAAAWLVTGPAGHFFAGLLDWLTLLARYGWARARTQPRRGAG